MKVTIEIPDYYEIAKDGKKYIVKEKKQVLSVEQMQRLKKLGMMPSETLLTWCKQGTCLALIPSWMVNEKSFEFTIPACTLQDILDMLPAEINVERRRYWLCIDMADERMFYFTDDFQMLGASLWNTYFRDGKTLLDAAYEMLVWCIEKGYVKTEGGGNV